MINWKTKRYLVLSLYPGSEYKVNDIVDETKGSFDKYTDVFKPLKWYEGRLYDFNAIFTIKYCRIINSNGYWKNGDILPVAGYICDADIKIPYIKGFILNGYQKEEYNINKFEPATEEEFLEWKKKNKISITA
jgi:hypothetical protein